MTTNLRYIYVSSNHKLSRYNRSSSFPLWGVPVNSIELGFGYILAVQQGRLDIAHQLLRQNGLRNDPSQISNWLHQKASIPNPSLRRESDKIYEDILQYLLQRGHNVLSETLMKIFNEGDPGAVRFVACSGSKDMVWTCGARELTIHNYQERGDEIEGKGFNLYGEALQKVFNTIGTSHQFHWPSHRLVEESMYSANTRPKFLLLVSDSQCRYLCHIVDSDFIAISGGRYHHVSNALARFNLSSYMVIIISVGVNMARESEHRRQKDWGEFVKQLDTTTTAEVRRRILFSPPFPHRSASSLVTHVRKVQSDLCGRGITVVEWDNHENVLCNSETGEPNEEHFARDRFHVNHSGFRVLWHFWCQYFPVLKVLPYSLNDAPISTPKKLFNLSRHQHE